MSDLSGARLYLVARARILVGSLHELIPDLAAAGVDVVQLREKDMKAPDLLRVGRPLVAASRDAGIPLIVNDRPDVALAIGADGVHLGQTDLPVIAARRVLPDVIVGRSTHSKLEIDTAIEEHIDYIAVGPVYETPTKPGRPAAGLELIEYAASTVDLPWFAIGGIDETTLPAVIAAGARRIAVVRAIADVTDPVEASRRLRSMLDDVPV